MENRLWPKRLASLTLFVNTAIYAGSVGCAKHRSLESRSAAENSLPKDSAVVGPDAAMPDRLLATTAPTTGSSGEPPEMVFGYLEEEVGTVAVSVHSIRPAGGLFAATTRMAEPSQRPRVRFHVWNKRWSERLGSGDPRPGRDEFYLVLESNWLRERPTIVEEDAERLARWLKHVTAAPNGSTSRLSIGEFRFAITEPEPSRVIADIGGSRLVFVRANLLEALAKALDEIWAFREQGRRQFLPP